MGKDEEMLVSCESVLLDDLFRRRFEAWRGGGGLCRGKEAIANGDGIGELSAQYCG